MEKKDKSRKLALESEEKKKVKSDSEQPVKESCSLESEVADFFKEIDALTVKEPNNENCNSVSVKDEALEVGKPVITPDLNRKDTVSKPEPEMNKCAWKEIKDDSTGYSYYWNIETNEVTWEVPEEYAAYLSSLSFPKIDANVSQDGDKEECLKRKERKKMSEFKEGSIIPISFYEESSSNESASDDNFSLTVKKSDVAKKKNKKSKEMKMSQSNDKEESCFSGMIGPQLPADFQLPLDDKAPNQKNKKRSKERKRNPSNDKEESCFSGIIGPQLPVDFQLPCDDKDHNQKKKKRSKGMKMNPIKDKGESCFSSIIGPQLPVGFQSLCDAKDSDEIKSVEYSDIDFLSETKIKIETNSTLSQNSNVLKDSNGSISPSFHRAMHGDKDYSPSYSESSAKNTETSFCQDILALTPDENLGQKLISQQNSTSLHNIAVYEKSLDSTAIPVFKSEEKFNTDPISEIENHTENSESFNPPVYTRIFSQSISLSPVSSSPTYTSTSPQIVSPFSDSVDSESEAPISEIENSKSPEPPSPSYAETFPESLILSPTSPSAISTETSLFSETIGSSPTHTESLPKAPSSHLEINLCQDVTEMTRYVKLGQELNSYQNIAAAHNKALKKSPDSTEMKESSPVENWIINRGPAAKHNFTKKSATAVVEYDSSSNEEDNICLSSDPIKKKYAAVIDTSFIKSDDNENVRENISLESSTLLKNPVFTPLSSIEYAAQPLTKLSISINNTVRAKRKHSDTKESNIDSYVLPSETKKMKLNDCTSELRPYMEESYAQQELELEKEFDEYYKNETSSSNTHCLPTRDSKSFNFVKSDEVFELSVTSLRDVNKELAAKSSTNLLSSGETVSVVSGDTEHIFKESSIFGLENAKSPGSENEKSKAATSQWGKTCTIDYDEDLDEIDKLLCESLERKKKIS